MRVRHYASRYCILRTEPARFVCGTSATFFLTTFHLALAKPGDLASCESEGVSCHFWRKCLGTAASAEAVCASSIGGRCNLLDDACLRLAACKRRDADEETRRLTGWLTDWLTG